MSGEVHVFDYQKHPSFPVNKEVRPNLRLLGHEKEGYGLAWNSKDEGVVISGSDDGIICIWDLKEVGSIEVEAREKWNTDDVIDDVGWNQFNERVFYSVGDDRKILVFDRRESQPVCEVIDAHKSEIMSLDASPFDENLLLTGSTDGSLSLWDQR